MRTQSFARCGLVAVALLLFVSLGVTSVYATSLSTAGSPDFSAGTVPLVVTADAAVTRVDFEIRQSGEESQTVGGAAGADHTFTYDLPIRAATTVVARAYEGSGAVSQPVWSQTAKLTMEGLVPESPVFSLTGATVIHSVTKLKGTGATGAGTMTVQSYKSGKWVNRWTGGVSVASDGKFSLPEIGLPGGSVTIRAVARNAFGASESGRTVHVYNFGRIPSYKHLVLVDKSDRHVYVTVNNHVTHVVACAIGMPWTPTPTGTFRIGKRHRTPNAVWGPWRLNFARRHVSASGHVSYTPTRYYIHGTNAPGSIGHMRSHGCVRLHNHDILALSTVIDGYIAVIRE